MSDVTPPRPVLVLVRDLLLASRVTTAARAEAVPLAMIRSADALAGREADLVVVDLNEPGALEAAAVWRAANGNRRAVGFVAHVDGDVITRAKAAGIDQVLPRSQFVVRVAEILRAAKEGTAP